ncbi:MAG: SRPBCC domain-containing protein [Actinomycetota bacterium]
MQTDQMPPIVYRTYINASPETVYQTLATGEGWNAWFTTTATVDAQTGGSYRFHWKDWAAERETETMQGPVVEATPPRVFSFIWEAGESRTTVRFELESRADGTLVTLTESGYGFSEVDVRACLSCAGGWGEALTLLKFYLEHGVTYGDVPAP